MKKKESKQKILQATLDVIGKAGLSGVTFRVVADRAQVPLGLTSYYFKNKDQLIEETFHLFQTQSQGPIDQLLEKVLGLFSQLDGQDIKKVEREWLVNTLTKITADHIKNQITNERNNRLAAAAFMHASIANPKIQPFVAKRHEDLTEMGKELFETLGVEDPETVSTLFLALTIHVERQILLEGKKHFDRKYVQSTFDRFFRLILGKPI